MCIHSCIRIPFAQGGATQFLRYVSLRTRCVGFCFNKAADFVAHQIESESAARCRPQSAAAAAMHWLPVMGPWGLTIWYYVGRITQDPPECFGCSHIYIYTYAAFSQNSCRCSCCYIYVYMPLCAKMNTDVDVEKYMYICIYIYLYGRVHVQYSVGKRKAHPIIRPMHFQLCFFRNCNTPSLDVQRQPTVVLTVNSWSICFWLWYPALSLPILP